MDIYSTVEIQGADTILFFRSFADVAGFSFLMRREASSRWDVADSQTSGMC